MKYARISVEVQPKEEAPVRRAQDGRRALPLRLRVGNTNGSCSLPITLCVRAAVFGRRRGSARAASTEKTTLLFRFSRVSGWASSSSAERGRERERDSWVRARACICATPARVRNADPLLACVAAFALVGAVTVSATRLKVVSSAMRAQSPAASADAVLAEMPDAALAETQDAALAEETQDAALAETQKSAEWLAAAPGFRTTFGSVSYSKSDDSLSLCDLSRDSRAPSISLLVLRSF